MCCKERDSGLTVPSGVCQQEKEVYQHSVEGLCSVIWKWLLLQVIFITHSEQEAVGRSFCVFEVVWEFLDAVVGELHHAYSDPLLLHVVKLHANIAVCLVSWGHGGAIYCFGLHTV